MGDGTHQRMGRHVGAARGARVVTAVRLGPCAPSE